MSGGRMGMGFSQQQRMSQRASPSLIQFTEILQMTGQELETLIEQALTDNPALEVREVDRCPACGDVLLRDGSCYRCRRGDSLADAAARQVAEDVDADDEFDVWRTVADQQSLAEHLLAELGAVLDDAELPIAEFLVGELDERGFLDVPLTRVAASLEVDEARVEAVLRVLQDVGPLGVGARSTEECLQLQLARWEEVGEGHPLARAIVDDHLGALGRGQYAQIAQALDVDYEAVIDARDYIRSHLRPYPISERADLDPWERDTEPGASAPDVIIRDTDEGYLVEVVGSRRYGLSLNPVYRDLAVGGADLIVAYEDDDDLAVEDALGDGGDEIDRSLEVDEDDSASDADDLPPTAAHLSEEERDHVRAQVEQARQFLTHVRERRETMRRVTGYVVRRQRAFLARGPRHLQPLTRAQVAEALDLHESTISRATAGKWVMLPNRQVVPYATFFTPALRVHDVLRELVEKEEKALTDQQLVELLTERGFPIARRTVAKYRKQMGILPSSLR
jgi:RNA polymerase sigma-54 factor